MVIIIKSPSNVIYANNSEYAYYIFVNTEGKFYVRDTASSSYVLQSKFGVYESYIEYCYMLFYFNYTEYL